MRKSISELTNSKIKQLAQKFIFPPALFFTRSHLFLHILYCLPLPPILLLAVNPLSIPTSLSPTTPFDHQGWRHEGSNGLKIQERREGTLTRVLSKVQGRLCANQTRYQPGDVSHGGGGARVGRRKTLNFPLRLPPPSCCLEPRIGN